MGKRVFTTVLPDNCSATRRIVLLIWRESIRKETIAGYRPSMCMALFLRGMELRNSVLKQFILAVVRISPLSSLLLLLVR